MQIFLSFYLRCTPLGLIKWTSCQFKNFSFQGTDWETVESDILEVAVDDTCVWGIKTNGDVFLRTGVSPKKPQGTAWKSIRVASDLVHITCLSGMIWGLDIYNHVQIYQGTTKLLSCFLSFLVFPIDGHFVDMHIATLFPIFFYLYLGHGKEGDLLNPYPTARAPKTV